MADKKVWTQVEILGLLVDESTLGDKAVCRAVLAIYSRQTEHERQVGSTVEHNGIGFNGADSSILSSFAEQIKRRSKRPGCPLSPKQMFIARTRIQKYTRQLAEIANGG